MTEYVRSELPLDTSSAAHRPPRIFFYSTIDAPEVWKDALARHFGDFSFTVGPHCDDPAAVDIALINKLPTQDGLLAFTGLKAVLALSAGVNQFLPSLLPPGVPLSRSVDSTLTQQMVGYAKTAVYRYHRRFHEYERSSREGIWRYTAARLNSASTVGIMGMGELGSAIALALQADGFTVEGWSRSGSALPGIRSHAGDEGLRTLVAGADIVINILPLTDATRGILCAKLFAGFKPGAFLINMGRGPHLLEADLLAAIDVGHIGAATLDVTQVEPLAAGHAFWGHPSILVTPHIAGATSPETAAPQIAENIRRAMRGEALLHQADLKRGY